MSVFPDPDSFRTFVEKNFSALASFARSVLGNDLDAEDIAQDALVLLYRRRAGLRPEGSPRAYLYRITLRLCLARRRREARHEAISTLFAPLLRQEVPPASEPVDSWFRSLTVRQAAIAHLYFAEDFDAGEIAERLRIAPSTVRVQLKRIRSRLRRLHGAGPASERCSDVP